MHRVNRNGKDKLKQKLPTVARWEIALKQILLLLFTISCLYERLVSRFYLSLIITGHL